MRNNSFDPAPGFIVAHFLKESAYADQSWIDPISILDIRTNERLDGGSVVR